MRTPHLLLAPFVLAGLAVVAPAHVAPAAGAAGARATNLTSTTHDLGTLGGKRSEARAVDGTIVVGWSQTADAAQRHAFAYDLAADEPEMIDLGSLRGRSEAQDVDGSVVVGSYDSGDEDNFRAFAYDLAAPEPEMIDLGTLGGGYAIARAVAGTVVIGMSETVSGEQHAFAYDLAAPEPEMVDLGTLGGRYSDGVTVDGSVAVGSSSTASGETHAFAYDLAAADPAMIDLGTLGGGDSLATSVAGTIITGESRTASGEFRAFAYDLAAAEPAMRDLGTLGGRDSAGHDVDGTTVVGSSDTASGQSRAFAYDLATAEPRMRDLGTVAGGAQTRVQANAIDGDLVIGRWEDPQRMGSSPYSFAYDLDAAEPRMFDLSTWRGTSVASDVDGDVVVGYAATKSGERATAWVLRETVRPMLAFRTFDQRVRENVGRATVRVIRYGRTDRAVTVRYRARADTAKARRDFVPTSGKLRFPRGVTHRSFKVRILDDRRSERTEYVKVTLARPGRPARLGSPSWSQLRIKDNDR